MKIFGASSFAACLYGILAVFALLTSFAAGAATGQLVGTWEGTSYEQSSGKTWAMTFVLNSDDTYSSLDASTDGKGSNFHSGTYSYTSTAISIWRFAGCSDDSSSNIKEAGLIAERAGYNWYSAGAWRSSCIGSQKASCGRVSTWQFRLLLG